MGTSLAGVYIFHLDAIQLSSVKSHLFLSPIGARTLKMPVPYPPPNVEAYTQTPSHNHPACSAVGAQIISLRSDDLVVPKLPACGCGWWWRLVSTSTLGDWWATCHDESCAQYSRFRCDIRVWALLLPLFTYGEGVLLGQQLRALFLETELEKRKKEKMHLSVSVPLVKGVRMGTGLRGLQGVWHIVQVCLEGCYVCENVVEGSMEPCLVECFGERCRGVCKNDGCLLIQCERVPCWLVTMCE